MLRLSLLTVAILAQAGAAWSIPVQVGYGSVVSGVVENFEASPAGPLPDAPSGPIIGLGGSSAPFEGFQFTSLFPYVASISGSAPFCASGLCLVLGISPLYSPIAGTPNPPTTAVFDELTSGTKSFGLKVAPAESFVSIVVKGGGGEATFGALVTKTPISLAFYDALGIDSVTVTDGIGLDDVVTSASAPVPVPATGGLLVAAIAGLAAWRRARSAVSGRPSGWGCSAARAA